VRSPIDNQSTADQKLVSVRTLVVFLALFVAAPAFSDEADISEEARRHFDVGSKAYDLLRWTEALEHFQAAYELRQDPALLFNIGQCQRQLGQRAAAVHSYRAYLEHVPNAPNRQTVLDKIAELEAGAPPPPAPLASAKPQPAESRVATVAPPPVRPRRWRPGAAGPVLIALGTAAAATGIGLAAYGNQVDGRVAGAPSLAQAERYESDRDKFENAGWAMIAVGGAAAVAGIVVLTVDSVRARRRERAR
jgi:tetratricopeptide (TPR) repeat protein